MNYLPIFARWVRWAPPLFVLSGLGMGATLFAASAVADLPLAIVVTLGSIIGVWAVSGAYVARRVSRRLGADRWQR